MSETKISETWTEFRSELREKCRKQDLNSDDFLEWIMDSIKGIMYLAFDYYIVSGPIPETKDQQIDVTMLVGKRIYSFTVDRRKKQFFINPLCNFSQYLEEIEEGFLRCTFNPPPLGGFFITDSIVNSAKLREFTRKILHSAWGEP